MKIADSDFLAAADEVDYLHAAFDGMYPYDELVDKMGGSIFYLEGAYNLAGLQHRIFWLIQWNRKFAKCSELAELLIQTGTLFYLIRVRKNTLANDSINLSIRYFYAATGLAYFWMMGKSCIVSNRIRKRVYFHRDPEGLVSYSDLDELRGASVGDAMLTLARMEQDLFRKLCPGIFDWIRKRFKFRGLAV